MATTPSRQPSETDSAVILRGTQRGLEIEIPPGCDGDQILGALRDKLSESPGFFAGNDVIVRFLGDVVPGSLGPLDALCQEFDLSIVGIRSPREERRKAARAALAVVDELAEGSAPVEAAEAVMSAPVIKPPPLLPKITETAPPEEHPPTPTPTPTPAPALTPAPAPAPALTPAPTPEPTPTPEPALAPTPALAPAPAPAPDPARARFVRGPIRSGCVLESDEHLVILGDVNPGAEVRSLGGITVLGRLRGVAHAGAGEASGATGFIVALELAPQQLRIGELVARAGDADNPPGRTEIAYAKDQQIIVETYRGALPRPLWGLIS